MTSAPDVLEEYVLETDGRRYVLTSEPLGAIGDRAVLTVDGERAADAKGELAPARLEHDGIKIKVRWTLRHRIKQISAERGDEQFRFAAPPGSVLAERERWERDHPALYATRHVAVAAAQILAALLGVSAFVKLVLARLIPDLPLPDFRLPRLPDLDLPDLPLPDWQIPWPDWTLPGWLQAVLHTAKFWGPLLVAIAVALNELDKNKKKHAPRPPTPRTDTPAEQNDHNDAPAEPH
ncbi:hypothetical protein GCM10027589_45190 [Actinocorallia lasiicapitis]